ncbi:hypothetical protein quinque_005152 [Culex quinquefasciatus]
MVSRRKILSRSRDDLNLDSTFIAQEEEEDVWYQKDKLYKVAKVAPLSSKTETEKRAWKVVKIYWQGDVGS